MKGLKIKYLLVIFSESREIAMVKKVITRQEVSHELVSDQYFMAGHLGLKIRQTLLALLAWLGVFCRSFGYQYLIFGHKLLNNCTLI